MKTRNPLIKENKFFKYVKIYCAELLPLKNTREKVNLKSPQTKIPCVEILATVICSEGYDYESRNKVRRK